MKQSGRSVIMSARSRPSVVGAGTMLLLLSGGMETAAFYSSTARDMLHCHQRRRRDKDALSLLQAHHIGRTNNHAVVGFPPQPPSRAGLWVMADSRYGLALRTAHGERVPSGTVKPQGGNLLQRITTIASKRSPSPSSATTPSSPPRPPPPPPSRPSTSPASPHSSLLPSDPIERFSGSHRRGIKKPAFMSRIGPSGSPASMGFAEAAADMPSMSSLAGRLISDLRSRNLLPPGYQQHRDRAASQSPHEQQHQLGGLRALNSAITRAESKLSLDGSEASRLRVRKRSLDRVKIV